MSFKFKNLSEGVHIVISWLTFVYFFFVLQKLFIIICLLK